MLVAFGDGHHKTGSLLVFTALCLNLATMHLSDGTAEVQADAGTLYAQIGRVLSLIEAVKETVGIFILEAHAVVDDRQFDILFRLVQHNLYLTIVVGVFECI